MKKGPQFIFLAIFLIIGLLLIGFGVNDIITIKKQSENYLEVTGKYVDKKIYSSDEDGTTYSLIYSYVVDGKIYTISTDYGTNIIPKEGSGKIIKYDPANPDNAVIKGFGSNYILIIIGVCFIVVGIIFFKKSRTQVLEYADDYYNDDYNNYHEENNNEVLSILEDSSVISTLNKFGNIYHIIVGLMFTSISIFIVISLPDVGKVVMIPFMACGIGVIAGGIFSLIGRNYLNIGNKMFLIGFVMFWFGFLIVFDYIAIKDENWSMFLASLIFWMVGIYLIYSKFKQ